MTMQKKSKFIRGSVFAAAVIFLSSFLFACSQIQFSSDLDNGVLLAVDEEECSFPEAVLRLIEYKRMYETNYTSGDSVQSLSEDETSEESSSVGLWDHTVGDITMAEYVKESVKQEMLYYTVSRFIADDLAIYLDENERNSANDEGISVYSLLLGNYDLSLYGITQQTAIDLYMHQALYNKVYEYLAAVVSTEIGTSDTKVIKVNYVLIPSGDNDASDTAESIRKNVKSGTDFKTACVQAGYTPQMNQIIKKGDMPSDFEKVAYALIDNEISDVVSSSDGFYVIECLEDYMVTESVANNNEVLSNAKRNKFQETYAEYAAGRKLRFSGDAWDKIDIRELS